MHTRIVRDTQSGICSSSRNARILKYDHFRRILRNQPLQRSTGVHLLSVLSELDVGESRILEALDLPESVQNHLVHMGFVPDALVTVVRKAPAGDPTVYGVDGMEIALRRETAAAIRVRAPEAEGATSGANANDPDLIEAAR
jgi:ferrous iron transport protein A